MAKPSSSTPRNAREWTADEHARYLSALERFPNAPWKVIAAHVGTRNTRQVMTHANKIALRRQRHDRGLMRAGRPRKNTAQSGAVRDTTTKKKRRLRKASRTTIKMEKELCPLGQTVSFVEMMKCEPLPFWVPVPAESQFSAEEPFPAELFWNPPVSPATPACSTLGSAVFGFMGLEEDWLDWEEFISL